MSKANDKQNSRTELSCKKYFFFWANIQNIKSFLDKRTFKVRVGSTFSNEHDQWTVSIARSTLHVTVFLIAIDYYNYYELWNFNLCWRHQEPKLNWEPKEHFNYFFKVEISKCQLLHTWSNRKHWDLLGSIHLLRNA